MHIDHEVRISSHSEYSCTEMTYCPWFNGGIFDTEYQSYEVEFMKLRYRLRYFKFSRRTISASWRLFQPREAEIEYITRE